MIELSSLSEEMAIAEWPLILQSNGVEQFYQSKDQAYQFDVLADTWQLSIKKYIYLEKRLSKLSHLDQLLFRLALARQAGKLAASSLSQRLIGLSQMRFSECEPLIFQESFHQMADGTKHDLRSFFNSIENDTNPRYGFLKDRFGDIVNYLNLIKRPVNKFGANIRDPKKGMYSEAEQLEINESLRISLRETLAILSSEDSSNLSAHKRLGTLIAVYLNKSIFRRPGQIRQLKWIDVLPVGMSFADHRKTDPDQIPESEHLFSDVDQLHIRTFRGKDGEFRYRAESRTHRIEPDLSRIILQYRVLYQHCLEKHLSNQGIDLSKKELSAIMFRLPIIPESTLFEIDFESKSKLFLSTGFRSESFHLASYNIASQVREFSKSLQMTSERNPEGLQISNNRFRHTVLTNSVWEGLSLLELSSITGVTPRAVEPYLDLKIDSRLKIDASFADKRIFKQFGRVSKDELAQTDQIKVVNEFGEESGVLFKGADCNTCESKLGRPIGCYGCDNFRPHIDGNHQRNLDKAERKLAINKESGGSPLTTRKLELSILYIRATILLCQEFDSAQRGIEYGRN